MGLRASLKPTRQVECVELMVSANNITVAYAQALVAATLSNLLVGETKPKKMTGVSADQMAKMGREMGNLQEQFKLAEQTYGQDILKLVLARGYLAKLMANEAILRHLTRNHSDVLNEFDNIVRMVTLDKWWRAIRSSQRNPSRWKLVVPPMQATHGTLTIWMHQSHRSQTGGSVSVRE